MDSCFTHPNWIIGRAKDGLDGPLMWLIAATLFSLYSLRCWARYFSFMLSGPVLWFHPDLNLSGHSRALPTPLNAQRRNELYSKALCGTKIREDMSVNKVCYVFTLSLVLQLVQQLCTVQLQRSNNNQDIGPALWLMRYLNSKPFSSCNWKKVTGRFRNCLVEKRCKNLFASPRQS